MILMMELKHFPLLLLFLIPFVYLCLNKFILRKESGQRLPPGKTGLPILGETLDFVSKFQQGVVYKFVTDRRNKYSSNVFRTSLMGHHMAVVFDAEGNKFVFSNENKLFRTWWPSSIDKLFPKSDNKPYSIGHSKTLRKLLAFILKGDVLREYVGEMDAIMKEHLQTDWNHEQVKVGDVAERYISKLACITFLGIQDQGKIDELQEAMAEVSAGLHAVPFDVPGTALHRGIKASKRMREEFEEMIKQRKIELQHGWSSLKKDLIWHILQATDDNGQFFSEADTASYLLGMLLGAYGTVHHTITNIMMFMAEHRDVYNSVFKEQKEIQDLKKPKERLRWEDIRKMEYSWNVACEVLRLKPPGNGGFKEAITDVDYGGYTIPKGWKIHWNAYATHMNPEYFPNPEKFDPSRFQGEGPSPYTFIPFGGGAHMCPGNEYARLAILVYMHNVVTKFRWEKLIPDEKFSHYPIPRPAQGLPVLLYPHKH